MVPGLYMEGNRIKLYKTQIEKISGGKLRDSYFTFEEALSQVQEDIINVKKNLILTNSDDEGRISKKNEKNSYDWYLKEKEECLDIVGDILMSNNICVRGLNFQQLRNRIADEIIGFSVVGPLIEDPRVSDIYINAYNQIFYRKDDANHEYDRSFNDANHYEVFMERIISRAGANLDNSANRILDFQLYGFRFNVIHQNVATRGICLALRKSTSHDLSINDLLKYKLMSNDMENLIGAMIQGKMSFMFAGGTGSGKTTSIKTFINHYLTILNRRLVICEDTAEVFVSNPNTVNLLTYKSKENPTTLEDLLKACLRQRPDIICIGEVRGAESETAIEAAETGHPIIFSMHANKAVNAINRLVTKYLQQMPSLTSDVVERIVANAVDFIIIQAEIADTGRRIREITEVAFDENTKQIKLTPIFKYDLFEDKFVAVNNISEDKASIMIGNGANKEVVKRMLNLVKEG